MLSRKINRVASCDQGTSSDNCCTVRHRTIRVDGCMSSSPWRVAASPIYLSASHDFDSST